MSRMLPASPPYPASIQTQLDKIMPPGIEPLYLFRVLARDERLFSRAFAGGLLDRGHLSLREREIVILRVCANNRSEYEWGVHAVILAQRAGLTQEEIVATTVAETVQHCWTQREQLLLRLCDELQAGTTVSQALWGELEREWDELARLELLMLCSYYRMISVLTNTLELPLESYAARFPVAG